MGTRAAQFDFLLSGYVDPNTGLVGAGYTAEFNAAGTATPKDVWTAYDKTGGAVQEVTLDATGSAAVWGDGVYNVVIKNLSGATTDTFVGIKVQWPANNVTTTTAATLTITTDMDVILADPTSTNQSLTLPLASTCDHSIFVKRIAAGSNTLTIVPSGSDTIDGASSFSLSTLNADATFISDGANWYGQAAINTDADTLGGYSLGTTVNTIPLRGTDGYISGAEPNATDALSGVVELATLAEVQAGTDANRVPSVSTMRTGLIVNGTTVASTSGTQILFGSIPSWVKKITVMLAGVSISGTDELILLLGDAGGLEVTGYESCHTFAQGNGVAVNVTTSFQLNYAGVAANPLSGVIHLHLLDAATNTWVMSSMLAQQANPSTPSLDVCAGSKALTGVLTQLAIDTNGTDTFDAGLVNIAYE